MPEDLVYEYGKRITIIDYRKYKDKIDEFCCKYSCGYEIYEDGSAGIICD